MPKNKIRYSDEYKAIEVFEVLMKRHRVSKSYSRDDMLRDISKPVIYVDFLKLCMEGDHSKDLQMFRKGLLMVLKSIGITEIAVRTGMSRVSLYRMLSKGGNPEFKSLLSVLEAIGMRLWVVDATFMYTGRSVRLKKEKLSGVLTSKGRRIRPKKYSDKV